MNAELSATPCEEWSSQRLNSDKANEKGSLRYVPVYELSVGFSSHLYQNDFNHSSSWLRRSKVIKRVSLQRLGRKSRDQLPDQRWWFTAALNGSVCLSVCSLCFLYARICTLEDLLRLCWFYKIPYCERFFFCLSVCLSDWPLTDCLSDGPVSWFFGPYDRLLYNWVNDIITGILPTIIEKLTPSNNKKLLNPIKS